MTELLKILIVDDEEELVETLRERLELRGFQVIGVLSGRAALAEVEAETFDVVLMDVRLRGEDGIDIMGQVKKRRPELPVILLTGHIAALSGTVAGRMGAADTLMKPVPIDALIQKMRAVVSAATKGVGSDAR